MNAPATIVCPMLLALALAASTGLQAADEGIYRSRDAQGNVIFSDRKPDESAEPVRLPPTNTMPEVAVPTQPQDATAAPAAPAGDAAVGYRTLAITAPLDGETIVNPAGYVAVAVAVDPPLQERHSLRLLLDGEPAGVAQQGAVELQGLVRGAHTLQLLVVDDTGNVVQESAAVTVQVHRPVPRRPIRPAPD